MSLGVGIVGLPNVGKSTLFNALTRAQHAEAANYPFCTIEPNKATVPLADPRLDELAKIVNPAQIIKATVDFIDIAGLVRGASRGEGLGNKFLANIREADAILHVVRCFDDPDILHVVDGGNQAAPIDPVGDAQVIETELILADYETLSKRADRFSREAKADPKKRPEAEAMQALLKHLDEGNPVRTFPREEGDPILNTLKELNFLTDKKVIYCANVSEDNVTGEGNPHVDALRAYAEKQGSELVVISAKMEADLAGLTDEERNEFLSSYGLTEGGLDKTIRLAYHTLGLASYFTAGPKEVRAWTFHRGWKAPKCAGVIHTDFERGFIRAEVIAYEDYIAHQGVAGARAAGVLRPEGKDYEMKDGDVVEYLFNV